MGKKVQIAIIVALTTLVYSNIFHNSYVLDDQAFIVNWEAKKSFDNLPLILKGDMPEGHEGRGYRPVRNVIIAFYHQIFGTNTFGYHLHAIFIETLAGILVYLIVYQIAKNRFSAFFGGLLFSLHPIHTETITSMFFSIDVTGVIFMLVSFYSYIKSSSFEKATEDKQGKWFYVGSIIFAALAFFTYEPTIVLPLLIVVYDLIFKKLKFAKLKLYLPFIFLAVFLWLIRGVALGISPEEFKYYGNSFYHTQLLASKVFLKYITLLVFPFNMSINHLIKPDFETFALWINSEEKFLSQSIFEPEVILSLVIVILSILFALKLFKKHPILSLAILWFYICYIPFANLFAQRTVFDERYIYMSSFGFVFVLTYLVNKFSQKIKIAVFIVLVTIYTIQTFVRNTDYKDELTLWRRAYEVYPKSSYSAYILGNMEKTAKNDDEAIKLYLSAIKSKPDFIWPYVSLASLYFNRKEYEKSERVLEDAVKIQFNTMDPNAIKSARAEFGKAHFVLGLVYIEQGKKDQALARFYEALEYDPNNLVIQKSIKDLLGRDKDRSLEIN